MWDIEQIKQLKARYFRLMDTKDWDGWKDLFTEDCVHHLPAELNAPPQTNAEYLELVPRQLANAFTTHHGHMPEITLLGPAEATGVWAMFDYVLYPDRPTGIKGYGHYYETYRKCDDGKWRISPDVRAMTSPCDRDERPAAALGVYRQVVGAGIAVGVGGNRPAPSSQLVDRDSVEVDAAV